MDDSLLKLLVLRQLLSESETIKTALVDVGLRVVRGPDWKWNNQDDGEGHLGTVVEIGKSGSSADKTVVVQWDSGTRRQYRVGYNGAYDLRTIDNAPLGIKHPSVTCNSCRKEGVFGMRWKCKLCDDYDLCTQCYMSDKHDVTHPFFRIQTVESSKVEVPKRQGAVKLPMKGIFASAKVVRGPDWEWGSQDGGAGKTGLVTAVCEWGDDAYRNGVRVTWSANDSSNIYRLGDKGKVDLKYIEDAVDGLYYRDHLPILGDETRIIRAGDCENTTVKEAENKKGSGSTSKDAEGKDKTTTKETGSKTGLALLSQNLKDLFFNDQFYDLTIQVKDRKFRIHKAIICARSAVFASKLQHVTNINIVELTECDPDTFEDVLFYIYTGKLKRLSQENVTSLYEAAVKYDIQALKDECIRFKKEGLSVDNVCTLVAAA